MFAYILRAILRALVWKGVNRLTRRRRPRWFDKDQ